MSENTAQDESEVEHDRATCPECGMLNVTVVTAPRKPPKMYCTNCQWDSLTGESEPLFTDGGVDQSAAGLDRDRAEELVGDLDDSTLLKYPLGPAPVWAYEKKDYLMLVRADGGTFRESSTTHERVVEHLQDAFWNEIFGTEPSLVDINEAPEEVRRAAK